MAEVRLENVNKIYDKNIHAVKNATLTIADKDFIVLVGPSGCGKSTLLRMIAGLEEISEGNIWIGDKLVNNVPPKNRNIAMVFQNYALYPHMTVFENMAFGLKLRKFPKAEIKQRVQETAELLGISELLERKPKALSGGQRQRVAVGRAIVRKPQVFLFDEPLSNLDAKLRVQMRIEISKLHRRLETTMIYVTHDQVEAMTMGDKIVVLKDGLIQQVDSPLNLYERPANIFVAGFIGSPAMNFFRGELTKNGQLRFKCPDFEIDLNTSHEARLKNSTSKEVILGIRPEHLLLADREQAPFPLVDADVEVIEHMGIETFVYLKKGQSSLTMRSPYSEDFKIGSPVRLKFDLNRLHLFDVNSEQALV